MKIYRLECLTEDGDIECNGYYNNKENAEKFIDFMCREDIALKNFEYITYSTPNEAAQALIEDQEIKNSPIAFPVLSDYENLETFEYLGTDADELYNQLWKEVKSE